MVVLSTLNRQVIILQYLLFTLSGEATEFMLTLKRKCLYISTQVKELTKDSIISNLTTEVLYCSKLRLEKFLDWQSEIGNIILKGNLIL